MKQETGFDSAVFEAGAAIDDARILLHIVLDSFVSSEWTLKGQHNGGRGGRL